MRKALILCHNRHMDDDLSDHFLGEQFKAFQETYFPGSNFEYHTVDILDLHPEFNTLGAVHTTHFKKDAWSDEFTSDHENEYDMVIMPDCGGVWAMDVYSRVDHWEKTLKEIVRKTLKLVSRSGILVIGKLADQSQQDFVERNYTNVRDVIIHKYNTHLLVLRKNSIRQKCVSERKKKSDLDKTHITRIENLVVEHKNNLHEVMMRLTPAEKITFAHLYDRKFMAGGAKKKTASKKKPKKKTASKKKPKKKTASKKKPKKKSVKKRS